MNRHLAVVYVALFATCALLIGGGLAGAWGGHHGDAVHAVSVPNSPRVCRSAKHWAPAPTKYRPCARITAIEEDGSVQIAVSDANGTVRYTTGIGAQDR